MVGSPPGRGQQVPILVCVRAYGGRTSCSRKPLSPCPAARPRSSSFVGACTVCLAVHSLRNNSHDHDHVHVHFSSWHAARTEKEKLSPTQLRVQVRNQDQDQPGQGQDTNTKTPEPTDVRKTVDRFCSLSILPRPKTYPALTRSTTVHARSYSFITLHHTGLKLSRLKCNFTPPSMNTAV
jgi:hypothetical protein